MAKYTETTSHDKVWGAEHWLENGLYCMKVLVLKPGFQSSLHYHEKKTETFLVMSGVVCLESPPGNVTQLLPGDFFTLKPFVSHRFWSSNSRTALVVEASTHHDDSDVVRLEESRKL